jgi:hypothetical protein
MGFEPKHQTRKSDALPEPVSLYDPVVEHARFITVAQSGAPAGRNTHHEYNSPDYSGIGGG